MRGHMQLEEKQTNLEIKSIEAEKTHFEWSFLNAKPLFLDDQQTIFREITYPLDYQLGSHSFRELTEVVKKWNKTEINHPLSTNGLHEDQLLFFDTETTGLGGGTGNTIFLLGYCHIEGEAIKLKQFFLPGPADEAALYYYFLQDVKDLSNLVTYNGKAFDWPQVRTRHTFVRDHVPMLPKFGHYDLLHAARRLWKNELPSCRLQIVEKELLGIERIDDTPGSLAPLLYFDYLKDKNPQIIAGVLKHNEVDVLSLITLYIHISKKILNMSEANLTLNEKFEIARWYEKLNETTKACELYKQVAEDITHSSYRDEALLALGILYKKNKNHENALYYLQNVTEKNSSTSVKASIELAKIYEHQVRDFEKALYYSKKAFQKQKEIARLIKEKKTIEELKDRIERLTIKCRL